MMKQLLIAVFFVGMTTTIFAQPPGDGARKEKIESLKIAFISNKLDLTPDEAKVFWPVYNEYSDGMETIRRDMRENAIKGRMNFDSMDDSQINDLMDKMIESRQKEVDHMKKYRTEFAKVIPVRKVAILFKAEHDFKKKLLDIIGERRGPGQRGGRGPMGGGGPR